MAVTYVDPTAEESRPADPYELFVDITRRPLTLGLIANSFPDATNFMDAVERHVVGALPGVTVRRYQKPTVDAVTDDMLKDIARDCDGVLAAWGH
jgi:hypothetical protein